MPSMMVHLLAAYKVCPDAPALFWLGNVAPDAIGSREEKDKSHFRDIPNRIDALRDLALSTERDPFREGVLLHLYLDLHWDAVAYQNFEATYAGEDWFKAYRNEIALASAWLFHHAPWSQKVWQEMLKCPTALYGTAPGVTQDATCAFINRNYKWHMENNIGPSSAYSPEFIYEFTSNVAKEYVTWRDSIKLF